MFNKDRWNEILEALSANKLRTLMTAFGVFWGISILILLLALTNGLKNGVSSDFDGFSTNSMFVWSQQTAIPYKGLPKGRRFNYKLEDIEILKEKMPELKYVSPRNRIGGYNGSNNVIRKSKAGAFGIFGDYPEYMNQKPMDILQGRFINYSDITDKRKVAVIGVDVVKSLYDRTEEILGSYIKINGVNFMVIGTFKSPNSTGNKQAEANTIFVPFSTFSQAFNRGNNVGWIAITGNDDVPITSVKDRVFDILKTQSKVHPDDDRAIGHFDLAKQFAKITGLFSILTVVGYFVGSLVLLSGVIGISNIMLIVVKERTKEIGVRRALGATPLNIKTQILQESLILTILSGLVGISFSAFAIWLMNYILDQVGPVDNFLNPSVNMFTVIIALFILVISGLLAGLIPASRAVSMKPINALRAE